jgi:hypothetical protein
MRKIARRLVASFAVVALICASVPARSQEDEPETKTAPPPPWKAGDPIPNGYRVETRAREWAILVGAVIFGIPYLLSAGVAAIGTRIKLPFGALFVPAIGPFIQMGIAASATGDLVFAIDGSVQTLGLVLLVYGITSRESVLVRNDVATTRIVPMAMGKGGYGVGLHVQF